MNTTQLECFLRVGNTLNFIRAAEELNISQPALSKQIKSLENELGVKLFERTTRSVHLTAIGLRFMNDAQKILQQINESKRRLTQLGTEQLSVIRIGYSDAHELQRITPIIARLRGQNPSVIPDYEINFRDVNLQVLREGRLDVTFALRDDAKLGGNLLFCPLLTEGLYCLVTTDHPLALHETVTSEQVRRYPQILCVPYTPVIAARTNRYIQSVPLNDDDNLTICSSSPEAYSFALSKVGIAILPNHLIVPFPSLRLIPIEDSQTNVYGIYYSKLTATPIVKDFVSAAAKIFAAAKEQQDLWPEEFRNIL